MATAMHVARPGDTIKLEFGVPEIFALKFLTGKNVESRFPGGRVMFTAVDERKLFLDDEDASDLERGVRDLGVQPADFIRVTKIRHARGGGHSIRVERVDDEPDPPPAPERRPPSRTEQPSRTEALLEKSVELARTRGAAAFVTPPPARPAAAELPANPAAAKMTSAMFAAVDAILETQAYATSRGLGLTFSEESVRAIGLSIYISASRGN